MKLSLFAAPLDMLSQDFYQYRFDIALTKIYEELQEKVPNVSIIALRPQEAFLDLELDMLSEEQLGWLCNNPQITAIIYGCVIIEIQRENQWDFLPEERTDEDYA